jgi:Sigma-70, region 4
MNTNNKAEIFQKRISGMTLIAIAAEYGVSRERIRQIVAEYCKSNGVPVYKKPKASVPLFEKQCTVCGVTIACEKETSRSLCKKHKSKYLKDDGTKMNQREIAAFRYTTDSEYKLRLKANMKRYVQSKK